MAPKEPFKEGQIETSPWVLLVYLHVKYYILYEQTILCIHYTADTVLIHTARG